MNVQKVNSEKLNFDRSWTLFLDRDGVINENPVGDYVREWKSFVFLPGVLVAMKKLNSLFGIIVVVTNQQGIGKGYFTEDDLEFTHGCMLDIIRQNGGRIDKIYFCPNLVSDNNPCRKPATGMAHAAKKDFPLIDFSKSIIVGDSITDMEFGRTEGMKTVFISDKFPERESAKIDYHFSSLKEFTDFLQP